MSTVCATNSSAFSHYEWQDLVWMTNLFNGSANGGGAPVGVSACFDLPIDGGPATLPNGSGCYNSNGVLLDAAGNPETCKISFTGDFDNTSSVRGYPAAILGSRAGCKETWGVVCGATTVLMTGVRNNASGLNNNNCDIYDLQPSQGATGYPAFAGSLPSSQIVVDYNDCGAPSTYNVFSDTYWHDVSNPALLPIDVNGNPITSLQNTINGISDRDTKMWNLNFWHDGPTTFNATGGTLVASNLQIEAGKPVDVYVKHETGGNNNFFYLAFVFNPPQPNHVMDYNAYANWVMSSATGAGTFLTEVYNDPASQSICAAMANPPNSAVPKTCRPPDGGMVVDSLELGTEMWGVNNGGEGAICFDKFGFIVDGQSYGKVAADVKEPVCVKASCTANVSTIVTGCTNGVSVPILNCPVGQLIAGQQYSVSVSGCCENSLITWSSFPAGVSFSPSNSAVTTLVASVTGNYTITAKCCDAQQ